MNTAIIVGGGRGTRMKAKINKILLSLNDKPLLYHTIKCFEDSPEIDSIILVINKDDSDEINNLIKRFNFTKIKSVISGGIKRQDSSYNGIKEAARLGVDEEDIILIHNAANPFVSNGTIKKLIEETKIHGAGVAAIKAKDTIKEISDEGFVLKTLDRSKLWQMQTPQAIKFSVAKKAFDKAFSENYYATDDVSLVERIGGKVKIVESNPENIKVTTPDDLAFFEKIKSSARVGLGQDSHRFEESPGKPLILGGVEIKGENGFLANSDGDVILHALFNSLSQAIGMKSLGCYADKMCLEEGITDSREYVKFILAKIQEEGLKINNIGIMLEGKKPRLGKYHDSIKKSISNLIGIPENRIGLTFTSGEGLSDFGKGLGIQCFVLSSLS